MEGPIKCSLNTKERKKKTVVLQWKNLDTLKGQQKNNYQA